MADETAHPGLGAESWAQKSVGQYVEEAETRSAVITIDSKAAVDSACQTLIYNRISSAPVHDSDTNQYVGMFDYQDVVTYLLLLFNRVAVTDLPASASAEPPEASPLMSPSHTVHNGVPGGGGGGVQTQASHRFLEIMDAAKALIETQTGTAGSVPVKLASDLSQRNPFCAVTRDLTLRGLVDVFADGIKRVVVMDGEVAKAVVSQSALIKYLYERRGSDAKLEAFLKMTLKDAGVSLSPVLSVRTDVSVLDALTIMSEKCVSSLAVVDPDVGMIGNISLSDVKYILHRGHHSLLWKSVLQLITYTRRTQGMIDGKDQAPVFGVKLSSPLEFAMGKLVATRAHRVWITGEEGQPEGIVSMTDIFRLFKVKLDENLDAQADGLNGDEADA